jgi:hypothetical protein
VTYDVALERANNAGEFKQLAGGNGGAAKSVRKPVR